MDLLAAAQLKVSGQFTEGTFESRYQRNNKRGGLKNLRCFPACGPAHKARGFCGKPITLHVDVETPPGSLIEQQDKAALVVVSEFLPVSKEGRFVPGSFYSWSALVNDIRTPEEPLRALITAERAQSSETRDGQVRQTFEFNRKRKGWHYGWTANKHSCNTEHGLRVYIFVKLSGLDGMLLCKSTFSSTPFVLYCRRRRRFTKDTDEYDAIELARTHLKHKNKGSKRARDENNVGSESESDLDDNASEEYPEVPTPTSMFPPVLSKRSRYPDGVGLGILLRAEECKREVVDEADEMATVHGTPEHASSPHEAAVVPKVRVPELCLGTGKRAPESSNAEEALSIAQFLVGISQSDVPGH